MKSKTAFTGLALLNVLPNDIDNAPPVPGVFTVYEAASAFLDSDSLTQVCDLHDNFYDQTCVRVVVFNEDAKVWKRVCQRAGVPEPHLHDLRRTAIRWAIRAGVSQTVAMKI